MAISLPPARGLAGVNDRARCSSAPAPCPPAAAASVGEGGGGRYPFLRPTRSESDGRLLVTRLSARQRRVHRDLPVQPALPDGRPYEHLTE